MEINKSEFNETFLEYLFDRYFHFFGKTKFAESITQGKNALTEIKDSILRELNAVWHHDELPLGSKYDPSNSKLHFKNEEENIHIYSDPNLNPYSDSPYEIILADIDSDLFENALEKYVSNLNK